MFFQVGIPVRIAGVHVLNPPKLFWPIYQIATRFLKEKIRKRFQLHYGLESLHKCFSIDMLPVSLGGNLAENEAAEWDTMKDLLEKDIPYESKFLLELKIKT